ncbi:transcriptional regulatory protein [Exophiala viscosa]|uniref:Transcriptional regulatory protein n=1 Tax=Exophiala viscosa TaxID=2486360 RepID=A0AAN6DL80_9EURO|nr:transcriptional regulatory protein [Exophiala viscosa]
MTFTPHSQGEKQPASALAVGQRQSNNKRSKACQTCRCRKIRCEREAHGVPCTTCRRQKVQCIMTPDRRRRTSHLRPKGIQQSSHPPTEETREVPPSPIFNDIDCQMFLATSGEYTPQHTLMDRLEHEPGNDKRGMRSEKAQYMAASECSQSTTPQEKLCDMPPATSWEQADGRISVSGQRMLKNIRHCDHQASRPNIVLPRYIHFDPSKMAIEDLEYLQKKGAFVVPRQSLRNELLRCYVQYIHAYLPLPSLRHFLTSFVPNESVHSTSLLLFHAIMLASTLFVDERHLTAHGYMTRKAANKAFFQRAKLLYDSDYETDRMTIAQAALLMTYWHESPDDLKDGWHWLGIAISHTTVAIRTCNVAQPSSTEAQNKRAWKRVWWSCYMRDRLIAIAMRLPMRIRHGDFNMPMLDLSDFETDALPPEVSLMLGGSLQADDPPTRVLLARMCISLVTLCICITQLLELKNPALGQKIIGIREKSTRLMAERATDPCDLIRCDRELEAWYRHLPPELRYFAPTSQLRDLEMGGEVINIHRAMLTGVYLTSMSILHRPQILHSTPSADVAPEIHGLSRRKARNAANDITAMYEDLYARDLIRYLPNTGVTCLLPATIIHLLDIKHNDPLVRQLGRRKFEFCVQALQQLRGRYDLANLAFSFLEEVVRYADVQPNPLLSALQRPDQTLKERPEVDRIQGRPADGLAQQPSFAEAVQMRNWLLFASTMTEDEKKLISSFACNGSSSGTNEASISSMADMATVTLADLGDKMIQEPSSTTYQHRRLQPAQVDINTEQDFESLVDMDMNSDLLDSNTNLGSDTEMDLQWLDQVNAFGKDD